MDIDSNKTSGEEEYRPADYDSSVFDVTPAASSIGSSHATTAAGSSNNKAIDFLEHLKRKNIIIAVVVLIGIFCVYKIVDVLFTPGVPVHKTTRAQTTPSIAAITPAPQLATTTMASPTMQNQLPVATAAVANRLDSLEQQMTSEESDLSKLNGQINDLQTSLSDVDTKIANLTTSLQTVVDTVAKQQADIVARQAAKRKAMAAAPPPPVYYVKAMVPGRAWLASQNGQTITVSLGNNLPGYGIVEVIDPNQGTLTTSSGAIIGYSSEDN